MENSIFYTPTASGISTPIETRYVLGRPTPAESLIRPKAEVEPASPTATVRAGYGFPGIPFEPGTPDPCNFCQGEDVVLDAFLYFAGSAVNWREYTLKVLVKSSVRQTDPSWVGEINNGLYHEEQQGYYTIWIPSAVTAELSGGTYYLDVLLKEEIATGKGLRDRTAKIASFTFNMIYCVMSPEPENLSSTATHRSTAPSIWPNTPDVVGR